MKYSNSATTNTTSSSTTTHSNLIIIFVANKRQENAHCYQQSVTHNDSTAQQTHTMYSYLPTVCTCKNKHTQYQEYIICTLDNTWDTVYAANS